MTPQQRARARCRAYHRVMYDRHRARHDLVKTASGRWACLENMAKHVKGFRRCAV